MKMRTGTIAVAGLAAGVVAVFALAQMGHLLGPGTSGPLVSAATADETLPSVAPGALTFHEVQPITVNALVVEGAQQIESFVNADGTAFTVVSELKPGEGYQIHLALDNASHTAQVSELVVDMPDSFMVEVDIPARQAGTFDVEQDSPTHWTIITGPSDDGGNGFFDLMISAYAYRYTSLKNSLTTFHLRTPYERAEGSPIAGAMY